MPGAHAPHAAADLGASTSSWHGENFAWWHAMAQMTPRVYACARVDAAHPPALDGDVRGEAWAHAPWSDAFGDIQGRLGPKPRFETRMKLLWDDTHLWFGCWMEEPQLVATLTQKNTVIFHDNDIEAFMDPDGDNHHYYEFEMNAFNTVWELVLQKPYKDGGPCVDPYNLPSLASSVVLDGQLNAPQAPAAVGWGTVTRWALADLAQFHGAARPGGLPLPADFWRINFSRVQWRWVVNEQGAYEKVPGQAEDNWTWSPQGIIDMHRPEQWGYLVFCGEGQVPQQHPPLPDVTFRARRAVMEVYHLQRDFHAFFKRYAASTEELGITPPRPSQDGAAVDCPPSMLASSSVATPADPLGKDGCSSLEAAAAEDLAGPLAHGGVVSIVVSVDGSGYEATCVVHGRHGHGGGLVVHTREDSKIWITGAAPAAAVDVLGEAA